jgi:hypothetical protein
VGVSAHPYLWFLVDVKLHHYVGFDVVEPIILSGVMLRLGEFQLKHGIVKAIVASSLTRLDLANHDGK